MDFLKELRDRLPFDDKLLRKVPIPGLKGETILELDLGRGLAEMPPASPLEALRARHTPVLRVVVEALHKAAQDGRVLGLIAHTTPGVSASAADELCAAVAAFRASGKPTVAWTESFGEAVGETTSYVAATAFDEVWLQPSGSLNLTGAVAGGVFLRDALGKLGIGSQIGQRKEYKSAAELFERADMSEANREMLTAIVHSANESAVATIRAGRRLDEGVVRAAFAGGTMTAEQAREAGFVDRVGYRDQAYAALRERVGERGADAELRFAERYRHDLPGIKTVTQRGRPVVAVVQAGGPIHLGRSGGQNPVAGHSVGSDTLGAALRAAGRDKDVRAVVLRIDSPGGSYVASDAIRREVVALREAGTTVVASMGSVAASGGYFIAMPCERIVAGAHTLTGSIGVLAGKQIVSAGLARIGVGREFVSEHERDQMFSTQREFTPQEWQELDAWLDRVYADFTAKAAADRGMPLETLEPLARGRVWTGADAVTRGLVDELGGLEEAIAVACARAEVGRDEVDVRAMPKLGPLDRLLPVDNSDAPAAAAFAEGGLFQAALSALGVSSPGVLSMPPFRLR